MLDHISFLRFGTILYFLFFYFKWSTIVENKVRRYIEIVSIMGDGNLWFSISILKLDGIIHSDKFQKGSLFCLKHKNMWFLKNEHYLHDLL